MKTGEARTEGATSRCHSEISNWTLKTARESEAQMSGGGKRQSGKKERKKKRLLEKDQNSAYKSRKKRKVRPCLHPNSISKDTRKRKQLITE